MHQVFDALGRALHQTELWSSIIGALVGGGIATLGQIITIKEGRRRRAREALQRDQAIAKAFVFKLIRLHSNFANISTYFKHCLDDEPKRLKLQGETWMYFVPMTSVSDDVSFAADELALLMTYASGHLVDRCVALDDIHNGFLASMQKLSERRLMLTDALDPVLTADNVSVSLQLTSKQRSQANGINSLASRLRGSCAADEERSGAVLRETVALFRKHLGLNLQVNPRTSERNVIV